MKKGDTYYYARIIPNISYNVLEIKIRTITNKYFAGIDKYTKQTFLFDNSDLDKTVFKHRKTALNVVKEAEKNKKNISMETYYEED